MTTNEIMQGLLLNDVNTLTLVEISRACTTNAEWVLTLVEEGIIEPISTQELSTDDINEMNSSTLVFPGSCLERAQTIKPHRIYRVDGKDLYLDLPVTPWEAALGARVKVPTPAGTVDMNIPAGSASGNKLRLKGRGIPAKIPGDLYVVLQIVVPPAKDEKAKKIYEDMKKELDFNPRSKLGV